MNTERGRISRREFLKLGGGVLAVFVLWGLSKRWYNYVMGLGEEYFKSEYFDRAADSIRGVNTDKEAKEKAERLLKEIHRQAGTKMEVWKSKTGAEEVRTRVSLIEVLRKLGSPDMKALAEKAINTGEYTKDEWVLFSSKPMQSVLPPLDIFGADGSPFTALDIAVDGLGRALSEVGRSLKKGEPRDIEWIMTGSPLVDGGRVTENMVEEMETGSSYEVFAGLKAEMIAEELKDPRVRSVKSVGHSWGGSLDVMAAAALEQISPESARRVKVLADDPVLLYGGTETAVGQGKTVVEGAVRAALGEVLHRRKDMLAKLWITKEYRKWLTKMGIGEDNPEQASLKARALKIVDRDISTGPRRTADQDLFPNEIKVYVRQGVYDETQPDPKLVTVGEWEKFLADEERDPSREEEGVLEKDGMVMGTRSLGNLKRLKPNVRVYGYGGRHAIDRFRRMDRFVTAAKVLKPSE